MIGFKAFFLRLKAILDLFLEGKPFSKHWSQFIEKAIFGEILKDFPSIFQIKWHFSKRKKKWKNFCGKKIPKNFLSRVLTSKSLFHDFPSHKSSNEEKLLSKDIFLGFQYIWTVVWILIHNPHQPLFKSRESMRKITLSFP